LARITELTNGLARKLIYSYCGGLNTLPYTALATTSSVLLMAPVSFTYGIAPTPSPAVSAGFNLHGVFDGRNVCNSDLNIRVDLATTTAVAAATTTEVIWSMTYLPWVATTSTTTVLLSNQPTYLDWLVVASLLIFLISFTPMRLLFSHFKEKPESP